jgi:hypothetical protein
LNKKEFPVTIPKTSLSMLLKDKIIGIYYLVDDLLKGIGNKEDSDGVVMLIVEVTGVVSQTTVLME